MHSKPLSYFQENDIIWEVSSYGTHVYKVLEKKEAEQYTTILAKNVLYEHEVTLSESKEFGNNFGESYYLLVREEIKNA